jgi:hypothetical protein
MVRVVLNIANEIMKIVKVVAQYCHSSIDCLHCS